jgi:hypothetical protein
MIDFPDIVSLPRLALCQRKREPSKQGRTGNELRRVASTAALYEVQEKRT